MNKHLFQFMWLNFTKTIYNYQSVAYYRAVMAFSLKEKKSLLYPWWVVKPPFRSPEGIHRSALI